MPVLSVMLGSQPLGLALVVIVALAVGGSLPPGGDLAAAAAGGIAGVLGLSCFFRAMAIGPMSIVAPIASTGAVVPVIVGLARGEEPTALQLAGIAVALCGVALAVRAVEHPHGVTIEPHAVVLAALSGVGFGLFFTGIDAAASHDAYWAASAARAGGSAVVVLAAIAMPRMVSFPPGVVPSLLAIAVLDTLANLLFALATRHGLLSLVSVAGSLYPVATILLARFILGERLASLQKAGVVLALGGVALIAAG
jgi:drug/metabolite transporter (DMT)-like permease